MHEIVQALGKIKNLLASKYSVEAILKTSLYRCKIVHVQDVQHDRCIEM